MYRMLLTCVFAIVPAAGAAASSPGGEPYRLLVCLGFSDDPIFTRFYQGAVQRQVHDQLANYFGELAEVEVVTEHALLTKLASREIGELTLSSEEVAKDVFEKKVFLMALACRDGVYQIRWRQIDGSVQSLGPTYQETTPDRQWLAKAICLAVSKDFSPVARVEPSQDGSTAALDFRGAACGERLASWLQGRCILQPYWVVNQQDGSQACTPIPHTVLVLDEGADASQATVVTGLGNPWKRTARVAGFRAIKLTTRTGRFRLRLLSTEDGTPVGSCNVYASSEGFDETTDLDRVPGPDRTGCVVATRDFEDLAYITVRHNSTFKLLVPITEDWCEKELRIPVDERTGRRSEWQRQLRYCVQDIQVLQMMADQCIREVNEMNGNKRYEEAEKRVASAVESIRPMIATADSSLSEVEADAKDIQMSNYSLLTWARTQLDQLHDRQKQLEGLAGSLRDTIEKIDAQSRAEVLIQLAGQAEQAGKIDEAIEKYSLALEEWPDQPQVRERLERLRRDWQVKSPEQEEARRFVVGTYSQARADGLEPLLIKARAAFRVLVNADDYLTVAALGRANSEHVSELSEIIGLLSSRSGESDRSELSRYQKLADDLLDFQEQVVQYGTSREERPAATPAATPPSEPESPRSVSEEEESPLSQ